VKGSVAITGWGWAQKSSGPSSTPLAELWPKNRLILRESRTINFWKAKKILLMKNFSSVALPIFILEFSKKMKK
jgi:hypothetical protein